MSPNRIVTPPSVITLGPSFCNQAGVIMNILELAETTEPVRGVSLIHSVAGSERSNHYHRTDSHWLYVISGEMHYEERDVGALEYPEPLKLTAGQMIYTPRMVEHRTTFPVETMVLSLSRYARDAESHERDLVRVTR